MAATLENPLPGGAGLCKKSLFAADNSNFQHIRFDNTPEPSLLLRRLAALLYDLLVVLAICLIGSLPIILVLDGPPITNLSRLLYQIYLLTLTVTYFVGFWVHGGQTLGMRTWRLKLIGATPGQPVTWFQGLTRFIVAVLSCGLGLLASGFSSSNEAIYDRISGTRMRLLPKANHNQTKRR